MSGYRSFQFPGWVGWLVFIASAMLTGFILGSLFGGAVIAWWHS